MRKRRLLSLVSMLIIIPLGFYLKFYPGYGREWLNNYAAGILYEIFWCLFFFLAIPRQKAVISIPLWVFGITCLLEFIQLIKTPILQAIQSTFMGKILLGTTFSWWDFPHYLIGCVIGWLWLRQIWLISRNREKLR